MAEHFEESRARGLESLNCLFLLVTTGGSSYKDHGQGTRQAQQLSFEMWSPLHLSFLYLKE